MYSDILSVGDKIDMKQISGPGEKISKVQYVSQILDFSKGKKLNIAMPVEKGRIIAAEVGSKYELCFYTKYGLYQAKCMIVDRFRINTLFVAVVEFLSDLEKFQRRQYFRLDCLLDIRYRLITEQELVDKERLKKGDFSSVKEKEEFEKELQNYEINYTSAILIDISGGGARFNSFKAQEKEQIIMLKVPIAFNEGTRVLRIEAVIVTTSKVLNRKDTYEHRVEFIDISKEDREFIVRYVFDEERKRRKMERGN